MRFLSTFFTPLLLLGAAAYIGWHNQQGSGIIAFFFLDDLFPTLANTQEELGRVSVGILAAVGGITLFTSSMRWQRRFRAPKD